MSETIILRGEPVALALSDKLRAEVGAMIADGCRPSLAVVGVGDRPDQHSYKKGAVKRCTDIGIEIIEVNIPEDADENEISAKMRMLSKDSTVSGILPLRPIINAGGFDEKKILREIAPWKDVDGATEASMMHLYSGDAIGYAPCTAEAVLEMLKYYQIQISGKHVVVVGRSLVIGKPVAMLMLKENASVTVCHSKSGNLPQICRSADIVVAAIGRAKTIGAEHLREGQTVIDVGINYDRETGKLCGDVDFNSVSGVVAAISPVPGGLGSVTTAVLAKHVIQAAANK